MNDSYIIELEDAILSSDKAKIKDLLERIENLNDLSESVATSFYFIKDPELVMPFLQKGGSITAKYSEYFINYIIVSGQLDELKFMQENLKFDITLTIISRSTLEIARLSKQNEIFSYLYNNASLVKSDLDISYFNHLALLNHPVIDYCPINSKFSVISSLLSNSYSATISKELITIGIMNLFNSSSINADILTVSALSLLNNSITIEFVYNIQEYNPRKTKGVEGYCSKNWVVIESKENLNEGVFIHELTHNIMNILFDNDFNPYKNEEQKKQFLKATKATLINIIDYLNNEYDYNISFQEQKTTYDIAQMIYFIILAKSGRIITVNGEDLYKSFVDVIKDNNLLNSSFLVLEKFSLLRLATSDNNVELAKALMLNGASTEGKGLMHYISRTNNLSMLDWLEDNKIAFNVDEHSCQGETALDIASTVEMRQALIAKGAVFYPSNYKEICDPIDIDICKLSGQELNLKLSPDLQAIIGMLGYSLPGGYEREEEHSESIAYFVQANEEYKNTVITHLTEPYHGYWKEVIMPAISEYKHNVSNLTDMFQYNLNNDIEFCSQ